MQVPVDSDWADDKKLDKAAVQEQFLSRILIAHMGTHMKDESTFERRGRVVLHWLRSNRRSGSGTIFLQDRQYKLVPLFLTDSQSALAVCKRIGLGRLKHDELQMLTVQERP